MNTLYPPLSSLIGASTQPAEDVRFEAVDMRLGGHQILRNINLSLRRRETVAIVGESGCGKTTLLKLMIGLLEPSQGRVIVLGKDIARMDNREQCSLRRHFGFLFQAAALFDSMSVADNIAFGLRAQGILPDRDIRPIIQQKLSEVGLSQSVALMFPAELSGGMRKRVGLARALALNPEFMLFDEPTTGLDPIMSDVINDLIIKVKSELGITAILVTHEMQTVRKVADRVIMLAAVHQLGTDQSQILFDGPVAQFLNSNDPRIRRFIEGNARGWEANGTGVPLASASNQGPRPITPGPVHGKEGDTPLRWIVPQILVPTLEPSPTSAKAKAIPSVPSPHKTTPVPEKPGITSEVEIPAVTVAPASVDQIPGQLTLAVASSQIVQDFELGKEFLPESKAIAESAPLAHTVVPPKGVEVIPERVNAWPLPVDNGPENQSVDQTQPSSPWEHSSLGEEYLPIGVVQSKAVPLTQNLPHPKPVEALREPGEGLDPSGFEDDSLAGPPHFLDQGDSIGEPVPPISNQVPSLTEPRSDSMVLEEPQGIFQHREANPVDVLETSGVDEDGSISGKPNTSLEQSP